MHLTYKYKLYHTKRTKKLDEIINTAAMIYNHCIALHKRYYAIYGKYLDSYKLKKYLTKIKKQPRYSFWKKVPAQAIQDIVERIDKAYKLFFRNRKRSIKASPPSFKKIHKYRSYTLKQNSYKIDGNTIYLSGHKFKFWLSRPIDGKIKTVTVKRDSLGDYYVYIVVEKEYHKVVVASGEIVGIDFGLKTFLTLSDGKRIESPRFYDKHLAALREHQRRLSRKVKGSNSYKRARRRVAKLYQKVVNSRRDFFHKLANELAKTYEFIVIEDLNIKAMQKIWGRKINDYAFSEFVSILEYKTNLIKIDRFYPSSKTCSNCGYVNDNLSLDDRTWVCPNCGATLDRDVNAAINICRVGASTLGTDGVRLSNQQPLL